MKNKKTVIILLSILTAAILATAIIVILSGKGRKLKKQLDLGQKYLSEMNYEEAIASFEKALEIDPMSVDAYLGLADAYIGAGDLETAKTTIEKGIDILSKAGVDTSALENKLSEIEELIAANSPLETEQADVEPPEEEEEPQIISVEPIISVLSNVWGRNWLDWTLDGFVAEFNIPQYDEDYWTEHTEAKYQNRAGIYDNGENFMWTAFCYDDGNSGFEVICKSLQITPNKTTFAQLIKSNEYADKIQENPVIHDDMCAFAEENEISSLSDVASYLGLNLDDLDNSEGPTMIDTDYGMASIFLTKNERSDGYYNYITVSFMDIQGFSILFTESDQYFRFDAIQYN